MSDATQRSALEAEAHAAAFRVAGHFTATANALIEVGNALEMANLVRSLGD